MFAEASRSARAIASPTSSGTCEPPGASRNTKSPWSDVKRRRSDWTSSSVVDMERAYLGATGVGSSPAFFGKGESRDDAFAIMDAAREAGITTFDTADAYGGGRSEEAIGEWLRSRRPDGIVITTKTFNPMEAGADHGLAPARVHRQLESSLQRLGVERVDLFLTHDWDP